VGGQTSDVDRQLRIVIRTETGEIVPMSGFYQFGVGDWIQPDGVTQVSGSDPGSSNTSDTGSFPTVDLPVVDSTDGAPVTGSGAPLTPDANALSASNMTVSGISDQSAGGIQTAFVDPESATSLPTGTNFDSQGTNDTLSLNGDPTGLNTTASVGSLQFAEPSFVAAGGVGHSFDIIPSDPSSDDPVCFMAGTMIATPGGAARVETLAIGDLVLISDGVAKPVIWLGRQTVSRRFADPLRILPIRVKSGALAENVPSRDLLVSPDHALLVDGVLIQAGALVNGVSIVRESRVPEVYTYYHVELADHSLILAENVPAETFVDNVDRMAFDNWEEHLSLYPEGLATREMEYPRAKANRQVPQATHRRLLARGAAQSAGEAVAA
jgi:hypothetical protein